MLNPKDFDPSDMDYVKARNLMTRAMRWRLVLYLAFLTCPPAERYRLVAAFPLAFSQFRTSEIREKDKVDKDLAQVKEKRAKRGKAALPEAERGEGVSH
jgi:hypothetical protein